jgi:hypothetical protein
MSDILSFFGAPEFLVRTGSTWKFHDTRADPGADWTELDYDDASWLSGPAQLGFGENDEARTVANDPERITTYFRHAFNVDNPRNIVDSHCGYLETTGQWSG